MERPGHWPDGDRRLLFGPPVKPSAITWPSGELSNNYITTTLEHHSDYMVGLEEKIICQMKRSVVTERAEFIGKGNERT